MLLSKRTLLSLSLSLLRLHHQVVIVICYGRYGKNYHSENANRIAIMNARVVDQRSLLLLLLPIHRLSAIAVTNRGAQKNIYTNGVCKCIYMVVLGVNAGAVSVRIKHDRWNINTVLEADTIRSFPHFDE